MCYLLLTHTLSRPQNYSSANTVAARGAAAFVLTVNPGSYFAEQHLRFSVITKVIEG